MHEKLASHQYCPIYGTDSRVPISCLGPQCMMWIRNQKKGYEESGDCAFVSMAESLKEIAGK